MLGYGVTRNVSADGTGAGTHTYQWDAEGRLAKIDPSANPPTQERTYNALGFAARISFSGALSDRLYNPAGQEIGIYNPTPNIWVKKIHLGGNVIASYVDPDTRFLHYDRLGSRTMLTNQTGNSVLGDMIFYPFGQRWTFTGTVGNSDFASLTEGGGQVDGEVYPTLFRHHQSRHYRWLSPDPG